MDSSGITEGIFMEFMSKEVLSHLPRVSFDSNYYKVCDLVGADDVNGQIIRNCIKGLINNLIDDYSLAEDSYWVSNLIKKLKSN